MVGRFLVAAFAADACTFFYLFVMCRYPVCYVGFVSAPDKSLFSLMCKGHDIGSGKPIWTSVNKFRIRIMCKIMLPFSRYIVEFY